MDTDVFDVYQNHYDGRKPNDYLAKLTIGLKGNQKVEGGYVVGK